MHPVLFYESLFFSSRDDLERLQPLSQTLLGMIVGGSSVLPLRPIYSVYMDFCEETKDKIEIFLELQEDADWQVPDYEASVRDGDFAQIFLRLQNICVNPFLRYWKAQEAASFTVVRISFDPTTACDLLDSVMNHLRPRSIVFSDEETPYSDEDVKLLARDSFLGNIVLCRFEVWNDAFSISSWVLNERGYLNYELWWHQSDVVDAIDGLIELDVRECCANEKLQSVCIEWKDGDRPQPSAPKLLSKPTKTEEPLPKINLTDWLTKYSHRVTQCEMHCFVNKMKWKRMEAHKWTVEYDYAEDDCRTSHVLQCRLVSL